MITSSLLFGFILLVVATFYYISELLSTKLFKKGYRYASVVFHIAFVSISMGFLLNYLINNKLSNFGVIDNFVTSGLMFLFMLYQAFYRLRRWEDKLKNRQ